MKDNGESNDGHQVVNASIPEWAKFAGSIIATVIVTIGWAEARFVSRVEWQNHQAQQSLDMTDLKQSQNNYAVAERGTAAAVYAVKEDVAEIKADVGWLRSYLDVSQPPPRKNGKKKE